MPENISFHVASSKMRVIKSTLNIFEQTWAETELLKAPVKSGWDDFFGYFDSDVEEEKGEEEFTAKPVKKRVRVPYQVWPLTQFFPVSFL